MRKRNHNALTKPAAMLLFLFVGISLTIFILRWHLVLPTPIPNRTHAESPRLRFQSQPTAAAAMPTPHAQRQSPTSPTNSASIKATNAIDAIAGERVLTFFNARDRAAFEALAEQYGVRILDRLAAANALRIAVPDAARLQALLDVAPAPLTSLPNVVVRIPPLPDAPSAQAPTTPYVGFGSDALRWLGVAEPNPEWGRGTRVAVLDTGISSDYSGSVVHQLDLTGEGPGQGTHGQAVASLINGLQGMVPSAALIDIKVLSDAGNGDAFTLAKGIIEATDLGAGVINISAGTRGDSQVLQAAIDYAHERDVMIVAAAGNNGLDHLNYPAGYDGVVAVGGVDANGQHLYFSNTGVDLSAPGIGVAVPATEPDAGLQSFSGTSAATPFISAAAALLRNEDPSLKAADILALLQAYSNDTAAPGADEATGAGILDAGRLRERDTAGIVDLVAIRPYLHRDGEQVMIDVFGQNQGTRTLPMVGMEITANGARQTLRFDNVGIGASAVHTLVFSAETFASEGADITVRLRAVGEADATPQDNAIRTVIMPE